jgi:hypothetical protein
MKRILTKYANDEERMKKSDAFVVVILSHGKFGAVYGADGYELKIVKILQYFRPDKCPALLNKPKLFFVQACQGKDKQKGTVIMLKRNSNLYVKLLYEKL